MRNKSRILSTLLIGILVFSVFFTQTTLISSTDPIVKEPSDSNDSNTLDTPNTSDISGRDNFI